MSNPLLDQFPIKNILKDYLDIKEGLILYPDFIEKRFYLGPKDSKLIDLLKLDTNNEKIRYFIFEQIRINRPSNKSIISLYKYFLPESNLTESLILCKILTDFIISDYPNTYLFKHIIELNNAIKFILANDEIIFYMKDEYIDDLFFDLLENLDKIEELNFFIG